MSSKSEKSLVRNAVNTDVANQWTWRDKTGRFWAPKDMETRHLFFTLRMIWNHAVPDYAQFQPFIRYQFIEFYGRDYCMDAVRHIHRELKTRKDILPVWQKTLDEMMSWVNADYSIVPNPKQLPQPQKLLK